MTTEALRETDDRIHWNKGDRLKIRAHNPTLGRGLSYESQETIAAEDGFSGSWDVYDGENEFSFYGFSVVEKLPADYEPCGTCGFDHSYDLPFITPEKRAEAYQAHVDAGDGLADGCSSPLECYYHIQAGYIDPTAKRGEHLDSCKSRL